MSKTPKKRGPGRPRTRPDNLVKMRLDVTEEEAKRGRKAAASVGEPVSTFARKAFVRHTDRTLNRPHRKE